MSDAEKGHLVSIWMLAADHEGSIPSNPEEIKVLCHLKVKPNLNKFIQLELLTPTCQPDDANLTPTCQPDDRPEAEAKAEAKAEAEKKIFGEKVKLTTKEYENLVIKFGGTGAKDRIENLDLYICSKGDKYKSHYSTILMWERKNKENNLDPGPNIPYDPTVGAIEEGATKRDLSQLAKLKEMT